MDDIDAILSEDLDNDTQMDPTNGRGSPVFAQTPQTKARETERTKRRSAIPPRTRGVGRIGRVNAATSSRTRSRSPPPERPVDGRVPAATSSRTRSRSPVADSQRGRERLDRSQRAEARSATLDAATDALNRAREDRATRSRSPSENPSSTPAAATVESRGAKKRSIIWNHCTQRMVNNVKKTFCNHCSSSWNLSGSTSTALQHLRSTHSDCVTEAEENQLNSANEPTAFGAKTPKRHIKSYADMTLKIDPDSYKGRKLNKYLCLALLSGSVSWNFLDNVPFGIFVECLSNNKYKLPSRTYMTTRIVPGVYQACKGAVSAILQKIKNISFTTDAWRSFNKDSYITITAHALDDDLELHSFVLDTSEIKVRHTSENLFNHINNVLQQWGLDSHTDSVTLNYNNTNANDIFAGEEEADDGVDYMRDFQCYDNDDGDGPMSESQTQMSESQTQIDENVLMNLTQPSSSRSNERNVVSSDEIVHTLTFVSDNAADISKALRVTGQFNWLGCGGHHVNLIVREAFKKVSPAASLLKKCKNVVQAINQSTPILYKVRELQQEFGVPMSAILQEMTTRWWSILYMLQSILKNSHPIIIALHNCQKSYLAFTDSDENKIRDVIALLEPFKVVGEQFSKESDVSITLIVPWFNYLKRKILIEKPNDSQMIKDMKKHMLLKLENRYNAQQIKFLSTLTYLDPRSKGEVNPDMNLLKSKIKQIVEASGPNIIPPTQNQEYHNLQNNTFATPIASSSHSRAPSHSHTSTGKEQVLKSFYDDDSEDDIADITQLDEKINQELLNYKAIKLSKEQKEDTHLLKWWRDNKIQFPCLVEAVKALLHTPATSVPSERIFSESGYIARARRSRILPRNLNKFIFIKKKT